MRGADQLPFRTNLHQPTQQKGADAASGLDLSKDRLDYRFALSVESLACFGFQLPFHLLHGGFRVLAFAIPCLLRRDTHAGTIHFDIQYRDPVARDLGQIELNGALDVCHQALHEGNSGNLGTWETAVSACPVNKIW